MYENSKILLVLKSIQKRIVLQKYDVDKRKYSIFRKIKDINMNSKLPWSERVLFQDPAKDIFVTLV